MCIHDDQEHCHMPSQLSIKFKTSNCHFGWDQKVNSTFKPIIIAFPLKEELEWPIRTNVRFQFSNFSKTILNRAIKTFKIKNLQEKWWVWPLRLNYRMQLTSTRQSRGTHSYFLMYRHRTCPTSYLFWTTGMAVTLWVCKNTTINTGIWVLNRLNMKSKVTHWESTCGRARNWSKCVSNLTWLQRRLSKWTQSSTLKDLKSNRSLKMRTNTRTGIQIKNQPNWRTSLTAMSITFINSSLRTKIYRHKLNLRANK